MSPRLPRVSAAQAAKALEKAGFHLARQSGSHRIYRSDAGLRVTLPYHGSRILHPKVLKSILEDAKLTIEEFRRLRGT
jgi:predicted RNA binding protein YcfA (HicA-like mRNA interferase family)